MTALNLEVVSCDPERELVLVKGAVPGARGSVVVLRDSVKTPTKAGRSRVTSGTADPVLDRTIVKERPGPVARTAPA